MVFGHLEVLHAKFHDRTISNLGDYVEQTNKQTDKANYYVDLDNHLKKKLFISFKQQNGSH